MTYNKEKQDFLNEIIDHIRQKVEVLDSRTEIDVEIRVNKPLRNYNPAVRVYFTGPQLLAEAAFWSGKTFEVGVYDQIANDVLLGEAGYFNSLDDVDSYLDKIVAYYHPENST